MRAHHAAFAMWVLGLASACRCGTSVPAEVDAVPAHYAEWRAFVDEAVLGDLAVARELLARTSAGAYDDGPGIERVGGALGYARTLDDRAELVDTTVDVAEACAACHVARDVRPLPPPTEWSHPERPHVVLEPLLFPSATVAPATDAVRPHDAASAAVERAGVLLRGCGEAGCHAG